MDLQLMGMRAFISGSTRGIGYAVARVLAAEHADVVLHGRTSAAVQDAVDRLRAEGHRGEVSGVAGDVADAAQVGRLLESVGPVDVLVNNVGVFEVQPFGEITDEEWHQTLNVNLMSAVRLSRHVLPGMLERGRGRIVMVSSESGVDVPRDMIHYGVSKAAMLALSNGLAKLTRGTEVTVNTILGGPTYSDGVALAVRHVAELQGLSELDMKAAIAAGNTTSLVQRFLEPPELATLVAFLASPLSSAINGSALRADGGRLVQTL